MVEMVHGRIATGETTVVSTAAFLGCGKQMEKSCHNIFPGQSLSKRLEEAMDLSQDRLLLETPSPVTFESTVPKFALVFPYESLHEVSRLLSESRTREYSITKH
jgi:hypothetical protein